MTDHEHDFERDGVCQTCDADIWDEWKATRAEIKRLRYKNAQYIAMLKIAAPAALAICDADISHDRG